MVQNKNVIYKVSEDSKVKCIVHWTLMHQRVRLDKRWNICDPSSLDTRLHESAICVIRTPLMFVHQET